MEKYDAGKLSLATVPALHFSTFKANEKYRSPNSEEISHHPQDLCIIVESRCLD
jgi:hypothetical protein